MKKIISMVLVAAMILGMTLTSFADDTKAGKVYYTVTESYTWSIASGLADGEGLLLDGTNQGIDNAVEVTSNVIGAGKELKITVASANGWKVKEQTLLNTLDYVLSKTSGGAAINTDPVLVVPAGTNTGSQKLWFKLTKDSVEKAGTYKDTLTFTAEIVTATP